MKKAPSGILPIVAVDRASPTPLYRQLYDSFREAILEGRLRAGQRIPSTRSLAAELRISRLPLLEAFDQLVAEGYFESGVGAGTFVASSVPGKPGPPERAKAHGPAPRWRRPVSRDTDFLLRKEADPWLRGWGTFRVSQLAVDRFPLEIWSRLVGRHARMAHGSPGNQSMSYGDPMGDRPFREAVAAYLRTARAVRCEADQIMVVSGSQQALSLAARVLLDAGSPVWVEEPGYGGARDVLRLRGARLVPVPVDDEGLNVAAGVQKCPRARAVYVTPSHQYPLGLTMSASRRLLLLDWARRSGSWIIEDDYDSEYRYESLPIASLQGLDRDSRVLYIGTFSKVLFPALRLGYIVLPGDLVARFAAVRNATDIFPPTFAQTVLADFIREGHFARHLRRMRALYSERRAALVGAIEEELGGVLNVLGCEAGMHLVATLSKGPRDRDVSARAAAQRLWAMPLSSCYLGKPSRQGFVLGFGGTDVPEIFDGVRRLRGVLER
ncbi:MAG TPA: PLP-dependent aminotransferase family protein [Thermoanaerobaculia bacterium]|nr:PLP-dependent aminotransferase family protein [Thermoanaerobaculia bacterium]